MGKLTKWQGKLNCLCWKCPFSCCRGENKLTRWVGWPTGSSQKGSVVEDKFAGKKMKTTPQESGTIFLSPCLTQQLNRHFHDMVALSQKNVSWRCDMIEVWSGYFLRCLNQVNKIQQGLKRHVFFNLVAMTDKRDNCHILIHHCLSLLLITTC